MQERIIVASGVNGSDLLKSLALRGENTFNLRVCSPTELARLVLMRSGIVIKEEFVSPGEENILISKAVVGEEYFKSITHADIIEISSSLRRARHIISNDDEKLVLHKALEKGPFQEKNQALIHIYDKYIELLSNDNKIDSVGLIRKAIKAIKECNLLQSDFEILSEYPLTPLAKELLIKVSGGKYVEKSIFELFNAKELPVKADGYYNCYGPANEVDNILDSIYRDGNPDKNVVAVTDTLTYSQLFFDNALLYDIPITFGTGIPISNSNPAKLLKLYHHWMTDGFFGSVSVKKMINSPTFDREKLIEKLPKGENYSFKKLLEYLGNIRFTNNADDNQKRIKDFEDAVLEEENSVNKEKASEYKDWLCKKDCIPALKVLADELCAPCEVFVSRYAKIREKNSNIRPNLLKNLDLRARDYIYEELNILRSSGIDYSDEDIIRNLLKQSICVERCEPGAIHLTSIQGALSCARENVYIAGLSSSKFPGSPRENYLLLDEDFKQFDDDVSIYTSEGRIKQKTEAFHSLAKLASSLGSKLYLSYPGLDVSELKDDNASSVIYEILQKDLGENATYDELEKQIQKIKYFEPAISLSRGIGAAYNEKNEIKKDSTIPVTDTFEGDLNRSYSPSNLEVFFSCAKCFMLKSIFKIQEPEEDDPFEVIPATDYGTLAHSLMEYSGEHQDISEEEFLKVSGEYFDRYLKEHTPLVSDNTDNDKEEFLQMMKTAFGMEKHREIAVKEEDVETTHDCGIKIHGYPDRVEKLDDGSYIVVDFKTKRKVEHVEDDIDTCLQVIIYAYILEKELGMNIKRGEYRYLRTGDVVTCDYNDEIKDKLSDKLKEFKECLERGLFGVPAFLSKDDEKDICKYCKYGGICGKSSDWEVTV